VALDYASDFSLLVDLRRAKIIVKDFEQMDAVVRALVRLGAAGGRITIVSAKNRICECGQRADAIHISLILTPPIALYHKIILI